MSSVSSASSNNAAYYASQKSLFTKLDTDQDGSLTKDEMVAGRPKNVSEAQATALYSKIDTANSDSITEDQFDEGMGSNHPSKGIESLLTGDAMAVLMLMSQQGGMSFGSGTDGSEDGSPAAAIYAGMDTDGDGSVTQAEFVAAKPDQLSDDDASALFDKIDTAKTGSITEDQFAQALKSEGEHHHGGGGGGAPAAASGGADSSSEVYDALDVNKDGVVSEDEFIAAHPADVTDEQATALFKSIDTEGTGSINRDQFSEFANANGEGQAPEQSLAAPVNIQKGIDDLLTMLESLSPGGQMETEAA